MTEQKVLEAYAEGSPISLMSESFKIPERLIRDILKKHKEDSREKRTFTKEFRKMIAQRDMNGVARSTIAQELELNVNTVRKACEMFGQALKEKATSDKAYTKMVGEYSLDTCPSCGSKRNNLVDDKTTFCMSCDSEHEYNFGTKDKEGKWIEEPYVLKINFEYIEE